MSFLDQSSPVCQPAIAGPAPAPAPETPPPAFFPTEPEEQVIRPSSGWIPIDWREIWQHRELLYFLIWRDVKVRYKQTVMGVAWAVLQPLLSMLIFTLIFGHFAKIPSEGNIPYSVFVFSGLLVWLLFSTGVTQAAASLINQQNLLTKIYFPRIMVPTAAVGVSLVDMLISAVVLVLIMMWYDIAPGWGLLALPGLVLLTLAVTLGMGYWLAALTVTYRDFRFVVPVMLQAWMYLSPVVYPMDIVPEKYRLYMALNPMVGLIDAYRSAILGKPWNFPTLAISAAISSGVFALGLLLFRRMERRFADIA